MFRRGPSFPWSLVVDITKNKSLEIQAKKTLHHMPDPKAQVNGDFNIVLSLKSEPRCLGAILTCWLERAETVLLKGTCKCIVFICCYKEKTHNLSITWKGQKMNLSFFKPGVDKRCRSLLQFFIFK